MAVSVNFWVRFIRIAGSNTRDNPSRLVVVGSSDVSGSEDRGRDQGDTATGSEHGDADESDRSPTPLRQVRKRVCFDQIDCRPTIYHPGGIFEKLAPLPPGLLRDPRAQSWGNVFGSSASHHTVRDLLRASGVDWESRLPCVLGPRKSRLPLFTRKQQRLLDKAREMDGVPDLSALLKGKLQLLTKKSTTVEPQGPSNSGVDVTSEGPKKKKKTKRTKVGATDEVPPKESAPVDAISEGSKSKKKNYGRKRSRGGAEGQEAVLVGAASDGHPRKRTKRSVEAEPRPSTFDANVADAAIVDAVGEASGTPGNLSEERRKTCSREGGSGGEPARVRAEHKKANEKAAKEKEVLRVKFEELEVRHPNTIAYPEKFFESAQAIAAHSHLRWPDLSREWIRRQQARIARADWESRLPCVLGPRKSRLPLFTRKQQRLLDKAREMDGVPDLSALLKGKLQLLTKKSTTVNPQGPSNSGVDVTSEGGVTSREGASREGASREEGHIATDQGGTAETSASGPKKKKKTKRTKVGATEEVPPEESAPLDATSEGSKSKKKKDGRKRSRGGAEGQEAVLVGAASDGHPRKRTKRSVEAEPRPSISDANAADAAIVEAVGEASGTPGNLSEERRKTCSREGGSGGEPARSTPDSSARQRSESEGSVAKRKRVEFPDRVEFSYNETIPLILNPLRCAELTRQIRGGTKEMPQLEDLNFKNEYIDAASSRARSDGSMNFLVEKYDSALKQTMIQLGSSEKLAQARLKAIERVRAEHKKANEKAAKEKEVLREKFEELEGKLKSAGAAKKELARENTRLEKATATLEKEKTELLEERDAAVEKLIRERQHLRDSRGLEVTRERERVEAAMIEKANRCFGRVRDHLTRLDAFGKARNLYGLASGTRKCLEMIKASGTEIPQEMIDVFAEQEKLYEAEATKFCVGPLSDSDLTLSPLVLPSRFVEDRFRASFDPYGSNVDLIGPGTVSQLITSLEITEEPSEEPLVDVTSVPAERVGVPEGGGPGERPENENLEEVPGRDNLEIGNTPVREEEAGNVGIEDPVLVSDSSSEGREGEEEEDDRVEEMSSLLLPKTQSVLLLLGRQRRSVKILHLDALSVSSLFFSFRHPNTIAYPEKFFESAQAIAAHSHLRWPDLSREWIRRQQARIARVDWESRLPCVLGPRKSRIPLFTRKQQRLLDKAREMDGVPDLSALLKGKLQLLTKKSTKVDPQRPSNSGVDVTSEETSTSSPKKKKKTKRTKVGATDEVPPEESAPIDATSEGSKSKKKKDGRKRSRGGAEGQEAVLVGAASDGHPRKRTKRSVEAEPRPSTSDANAANAAIVDAVGEASGTPGNLSEGRRKTCSREIACSCVEFIPKVIVQAFLGIGVNCRDTPRLPCIQRCSEIIARGAVAIFEFKLSFQNISQIFEHSLGRANGVDWFVGRIELPYPLVPSFSADYES
ncbi:hypothetical protein DY000_02040684 [Brassica cretica]|uniref:Uncharacterized protein n=1 Tax=Brassica cretica TaxID=69181 RepID=A0ABQ7BIY8_BRACR|nr:hypothetical protein DY000_02040684 [Brassica cretica]